MKLCAGILLVLVSVSCASVKTSDTSVQKRYTKYGIAKLPSSWERRNFRNADLFFQHNESDATIHVNAQCEKLSDSPLEALTSQMLVGMGKYDLLSQKRMTFGERDALITEVNVNLDGMTRYLKIMVMRKNRCVYDAVLSMHKPANALIKDFDDMVSSFWAEAEL